MRMKYTPYLLTISSNMPNTQRFLDSVKEIDVEHISVQFKPYYYKEIAYKLLPFPYPGNLARFKFVPENLDPNRFLIFTDTDDVIFQKDLPYLDFFDNEIYVADEHELHKNSYWKSYCDKYSEFKCLLDRTIYNEGCFAMKVFVFYDLIKYINSRFDYYFPRNIDQLLFNKWLIKWATISSDNSLFSTLYNNINKGFIEKIDGVWKTKKGEVISVVHGNGSTKNLL